MPESVIEEEEKGEEIESPDAVCSIALVLVMENEMVNVTESCLLLREMLEFIWTLKVLLDIDEMVGLRLAV